MAKAARAPAKAPPKPAARPRAAAAARRPAGRSGGASGWSPRRWVAIGIIVFAVLVGLPLAAAMMGEVWAVILGALLAGFALGRATAPR